MSLLDLIVRVARSASWTATSNVRRTRLGPGGTDVRRAAVVVPALASRRPSDDPLLISTLERWRPDLLPRLGDLADGTIADKDRESIQMALNDEFLHSGLKPDDEPNARGIELERLIDEVSPYAEEKRRLLARDHRASS